MEWVAARVHVMDGRTFRSSIPITDKPFMKKRKCSYVCSSCEGMTCKYPIYKHHHTISCDHETKLFNNSKHNQGKGYRNSWKQSGT